MTKENKTAQELTLDMVQETISYLSRTVKEGNGDNKWVNDMANKLKLYKIVEQALTPPSDDAVSEALKTFSCVKDWGLAEGDGSRYHSHIIRDIYNRIDNASKALSEYKKLGE